jgi:hypothetical protein
MVDLLAQQPPRGSTREDLVALLLEAANALQAGEPVPVAAARYLGRALAGWLADGGDLERDHLRVGAIAGSHRTAMALARNWQRRRCLGRTKTTPPREEGKLLRDR